MKFLKKFRKGQKGFTLIELLVVIAILGVIAAVAVPNVLSFMGKGDTAAMDAEKHNGTVAATAALYDDTDHSITEVGSATTYVQITATPGGTLGLVSTYLVNNTKWFYYIEADGTVHQNIDASP